MLDIELLLGSVLILSFGFYGLIGAINKEIYLPRGATSGSFAKFTGKKAIRAGLLTFVGMGVFSGGVLASLFKNTDIFTIVLYVGFIILASFLLSLVEYKTKLFHWYPKK